MSEPIEPIETLPVPLLPTTLVYGRELRAFDDPAPHPVSARTATSYYASVLAWKAYVAQRG